MDMNARFGIFCTLLSLTLLFSISLPQGVFGEERLHTVQKGETFYSIARSLGVKAEDLMKLNGITDPTRLREGQRLSIPGPAGTVSQQSSGFSVGTSQSGGFISYRVLKGDTFYSLTRSFSVTERAIREANNLPESYRLREGDALRIPTGAALASNTSPAVKAPTGVQVPPAAVSVPGGTENLSLSWPVSVREISYMTGKLSGVMITGTKAESVNSLTWGTVLAAGPYRGFGRVVIIQVDGGYLYVYGGCESLSVKEGDRVGPGNELGKLGIDAVSNKPQLFFMVYRSNAPIDPAKAPRA